MRTTKKQATRTPPKQGTTAEDDTKNHLDTNHPKKTQDERRHMQAHITLVKRISICGPAMISPMPGVARLAPTQLQRLYSRYTCMHHLYNAILLQSTPLAAPWFQLECGDIFENPVGHTEHILGHLNAFLLIHGVIPIMMPFDSKDVYKGHQPGYKETLNDSKLGPLDV